MRRQLAWPLLIGTLAVFWLYPTEARAMHIMEGFLPPLWCLFWAAVTLPFIVLGFYSIKKTLQQHPETKMLLGVAGAFAFVLSALKLPSVTGSSSHPTGIGLGTVLFGPLAMSVLGLIVLLFQALLLAHGGLTTLGANTFSMAVVGPLVAWGVYKLGSRLRAPGWLGVFLVAALGDLSTYVVTSLQLALAFPAPMGGVWGSFMKFAGIFAVTQVPLAVSEGLLTVLVFRHLATHSTEELQELGVPLRVPEVHIK